MTLRILMFSPHFAPLANPEAMVSSNLALAFLKAGWHIDVITRDFSTDLKYAYAHEWNATWAELQPFVHQVCYQTGGQFVRLADVSYSAFAMGHFVHGCRWARHARDVGIALWARAPYDVIISRSPPDSAHLAAMAVARATGRPWIANWNDPPEGIMPAPYEVVGAKTLGFHTKRFLSEVMRTANMNSFPAARFRDHIAKYLPLSVSERSVIIPHIASERVNRNVTPSPRGAFVLCHAGYLSKERDPSPFLSALAQLKVSRRLDSELKCRLIGIGGGDLAILVQKFGLANNVELCGMKDYGESQRELAKSSVNVVIEAPCEEGIFLPAKIADYASAGRPILAVSPRRGTLDDLLRLHGGGIAADCTSAAEITRALEKLYDAWKAGVLDTCYGPTKLAKIFSPSSVIAVYREVYERIGISRQNI